MKNEGLGMEVLDHISRRVSGTIRKADSLINLPLPGPGAFCALLPLRQRQIAKQTDIAGINHFRIGTAAASGAQIAIVGNASLMRGGNRPAAIF